MILMLQQFEIALRKRSEVLAQRLQPGLAPSIIQKKLERARVVGNVEPIVSLFSWRNGSELDRSISRIEATPFLQSAYIFLNFERMLMDFKSFYEYSNYHKKYLPIIGKYFPLFWNGFNNWIAVNIKSSGTGEIVLLLTHEEEIARLACVSFKIFIEDAIKANESNLPMEYLRV